MENIDKRNANVDILKGFLVICVLLGHAIQRGMIVDFDNNLLFKYIYTFHMPMFVLLSGYLIYFNKKPVDFRYVVERAKRLLMPTIIWSYLIWIVRDLPFVGIKPFIVFPNSIIEYSKTLLLHPNFIIWFLYVLFIYNIILFIGKKLPEKILILFLIMIFIFLSFLPKDYFGLYQIHQYYIFFVIGYFIAKNKIFYMNNQFYLLTPSIIYMLINFNNFNFTNTFTVDYYLIALSSMIIIYNFSLIKAPKAFKDILIWLGQNSMEIYLIQCLFLNIGFGTGALRIITIFASALIISVTLTYLTNKVPLIKKILFCK